MVEHTDVTGGTTETILPHQLFEFDQGIKVFTAITAAKRRSKKGHL